MQFGLLSCLPLSVEEAIDFSDLDNQLVGVHGVLYYGEGCEENEFVLLSKNGPFDGNDPLTAIHTVDRNKCLLIDEPNLEARLGKSGACGLFRWKHDAIVVGQIRRVPGSKHPVRIHKLLLIVLQSWDDFGGVGRPYHSLRLVAFPRHLPSLPWSGFKGDRHVAPILLVDP